MQVGRGACACPRPAADAPASIQPNCNDAHAGADCLPVPGIVAFHLHSSPTVGEHHQDAAAYVRWAGSRRRVTGDGQQEESHRGWSRWPLAALAQRQNQRYGRPPPLAPHHHHTLSSLPVVLKPLQCRDRDDDGGACRATRRMRRAALRGQGGCRRRRRCVTTMFPRQNPSFGGATRRDTRPSRPANSPPHLSGSPFRSAPGSGARCR